MDKKEAQTKTFVVANKTALTLFLSGAAFAIPVVLDHPQLLTGTFVNALLLLTAYFLPFKTAYKIALLPSLSVLLKGVIFGPLTISLYYMIPFIWLGNILLMFVFKKIISANRNYFFALLPAAIIKTSVLLIPAFILIKIKILPLIFLNAMGIVQLITALSGGVLVFILSKIYNRINS
ncbi:MAG: hypothetical protein M1524_00760 [Patescibacteria group bacterium]|nr:hypothetical protein [Patescibacteria group bacterium]